MRTALAAAVILAVSAAAARSARADGCRGSGGGGGGGGGSGGGGGDLSASTSGCDEVSDVVGHQRCGRFGASWGERARLPPLAAEVGFFTRQLDTGFAASGVMEHETGSFAYRAATAGERATAAGAAMRLAMALPAHLYVGAEVEIGALVSGGAADVVMGEADGASGPAPTMTAGERLYLGAGGVAGVRGRLGRAALSAEVVGGVRDVSLSVQSRHGACILSDAHHRTAAFVEPRVRVDVWLSPWLTVAGFAGSEIDGASRMIGASFAFHTRAFDGGL